jgi:hypothetical protein
MQTQRQQNPDVNSYDPNTDPAEDSDTDIIRDDDANDIERKPDDRDVIPLPPDAPHHQPIEDPPHGDESPVGDVDDSPKRITG